MGGWEDASVGRLQWQWLMAQESPGPGVDVSGAPSGERVDPGRKWHPPPCQAGGHLS